VSHGAGCVGKLLISVGVCMLAILFQGQDANWDLRNYHLYNAIAWVDGRLAIDVAPAQLQTWHNPTLDVPMALAVQAGAPGWLVSIWLAAFTVAAVYFALGIIDALWPRQKSWKRSVAAALVVISGAGMWSTAGTTMNDAMVAAAVLGGIARMLTARDRGVASTWLVIGLAAGLAAGLKLTAAIYCIAFFAAALVGPLRTLPSRVAWLGLGGTIAFAIAAGPWMWTLWTLYRNPLFPYMNQWFHSPDALPVSWADTRFLPQSALDIVLAPFRLLKNNKHFSEVNLADPRLFLGWIVLFAGTWLSIRSKQERDEAGGTQWRALFVFALVSFLVWAYMYGIYRYVLPLEALFSVLVVGAVGSMPKPRWRTACLVAVVLVMVAATNRPSWWRQPFRTPMIAVEFPTLPPNTLLLMDSNAPIGHIAAFAPAGVPVVAIGNVFIAPDRCTRLQARAFETVTTHAGPMFLVKPQGEVPTHLQNYGLVQQGCAPLPDSLMPAELCEVTRTSQVMSACDGPRPDR